MAALDIVMSSYPHTLTSLFGVVALATLVACAAGPAAGREDAPAPLTGGHVAANVTATTPLPTLDPGLSAATSPASSAGAPGQSETSAWQLSELTTFYAGTSSELPEGTLVSNYVLTGKATATAGTLMKEGKFQLVLGAFWPNQDLPGQPAGSWYISGNWTLTDPTVPTPAVRQRQPPGVVTGVLVTKLDLDPTKPGQALMLPITLPIARVNGVWARGAGTLSLDPDRGGGLLTLVLDRRAP
jgi:hypothetical protein